MNKFADDSHWDSEDLRPPASFIDDACHRQLEKDDHLYWKYGSVMDTTRPPKPPAGRWA